MTDKEILKRYPNEIEKISETLRMEFGKRISENRKSFDIPMFFIEKLALLQIRVTLLENRFQMEQQRLSQEDEALNKYLENLRISSASIDPRRDRDRALGFKAGYSAASPTNNQKMEQI